MQAAMHSMSSKARRSWKHRIGLPALMLVTVAASAIFGLQTLGVHPAQVAGHAASSDTLRLKQAVKDMDEAASSAVWAQMRAMDRAKASANGMAATTVLIGIGCGADCLTLVWPDGTESTNSLTFALDYAAICGCSIAMQSP